MDQDKRGAGGKGTIDELEGMGERVEEKIWGRSGIKEVAVKGM